MKNYKILLNAQSDHAYSEQEDNYQTNVVLDIHLNTKF